MSSLIGRPVLFDTGFWIALYDAGDEHHEAASSLWSRLDRTTVVIPWPILYEVLRTTFVKNPINVDKFAKLVVTPRFRRLADEDYRDAALAKTATASQQGRNLSLVDSLLREVLTDVNVRLYGLVTFNVKDFADVCRRRHIPILPERDD
jgi:predicted nucleic acid-binding protein